MKWILDFQLFLFDFDGLLVNTEHLQFQAYVNMLAEHGVQLNWSFAQFCAIAHLHAEALKEAIYAEFPNLEPDWDLLHREKKEIYLRLIASGKIELMPGVEPLLRALEAARISRCVVTHSAREQTLLIRSQIPLLKTLPHWITREEYARPKPAPDGYLRAIELYGKKGDRIIGFEDSLRGLRSLQETPALSVLICPPHYPLLEIAAQGDVVHFESFEQIPSDSLL
ncbi:MAG: HAD family phosphatase [Chlamydiota bacterium]